MSKKGKMRNDQSAEPDRTHHSSLITAEPITHHFGLFQWLRWRVVRNAGTLLLSNSRVRLVTIILCSLLVAGSVFAGSYEGFWLLQRQSIPFSGRIVGTLFDFLFLALAVLLVFSG